MFAVRFFAAAMLAAVLPCASAAEPVSSKLSQLSLTTTSPQPVALRLLAPDSLAATSNRMAVTTLAGASIAQPRNPQLSGLAAAYPPSGTNGLALTLNLQSAQGMELRDANAPTSLTTRIQALSNPTAVQPTSTWLTPKVTSELLAKPLIYGAGPR
jgi:hypothetical protein